VGGCLSNGLAGHLNLFQDLYPERHPFLEGCLRCLHIPTLTLLLDSWGAERVVRFLSHTVDSYACVLQLRRGRLARVRATASTARSRWRAGRRPGLQQTTLYDPPLATVVLGSSYAAHKPGLSDVVAGEDWGETAVFAQFAPKNFHPWGASYNRRRQNRKPPSRVKNLGRPRRRRSRTPSSAVGTD